MKLNKAYSLQIVDAKNVTICFENSMDIINESADNLKMV